MRIALCYVVAILLCVPQVDAAETEEKPAKKNGPVESVLGMPVKALEPIVTGGASAEKPKEGAKMAPAKTMKEMTPAELSEDMARTLDSYQEILSYMPGLKKEQDQNGKAVYTYQGIQLDSLDKETLEKLSGRVRNEAVRIRTDRLNRQMQMIRRAQQMSRNARTASGVPSTPKVQQLPRIPGRLQLCRRHRRVSLRYPRVLRARDKRHLCLT